MTDAGEMFLRVVSIDTHFVTLEARLLVGVGFGDTVEAPVGQLQLPRMPRWGDNYTIPEAIADEWHSLMPGDRLSGTFMLLPDGMEDDGEGS